MARNLGDYAAQEAGRDFDNMVSWVLVGGIWLVGAALRAAFWLLRAVARGVAGLVRGLLEERG